MQAKLGGPRRFPPAEWNELYSVAQRYGGVALVAHRPERGHLEFLQLLDRKPDNGVRGPAAPCEAWIPWRVEPNEGVAGA